MPDDARWHRDQQKQEWSDMLAGLSAVDLIKDTWTGDQLAGETLARIARLLDERESSRA